MADYLPLVVLWLATAGLIGSLVAVWVLSARLEDEAPTSNVIVLPPRAQRSGPTHVVRREAPVLFDYDALEHA